MHHKIGVKFNFVKHAANNLVLSGLVSIIFGVLIVLYPALLSILVSALLIIIGLVTLAFGVRLQRYSKFEVKL